MEKFKPYAFLFLAALLYGQGFPNHLGFIFPLGPIAGSAILFWYILNAPSTKCRLGYYLFYNSILNIHSFSWITGTLQEFGALPWIAAAAMNSFYAFVFNPHIWLFIFILKLIESRKPDWKATLFSDNLNTLIIASAFTMIEYYTPQQFPVMLGQPWIIFGGNIYLTRIFGLISFSFFSYLALAEILRYKIFKTFSKTHLTSICLFIILNIVLGIQEQSLFKAKAKLQENSFQVRMVQANISNFLKTESEKGGFHSVSTVLDQYEKLSLEDSKEKLDLIIWPETAYPYPLYSDKENILATQVPTIFTTIAYQMNAPILFGGYDHFQDNPDGSYYKTEHNAALFVNTLGQLEETYHKHILIPFGETLPFGPLNEPLSKVLTEMAFFKEGEKKPIFETENGLKFLTTICYEKLRPEFLRDYLNQAKRHPDIMINLTNDSWYGNTLEPELHLFLARWRSAELNMATLRSTNTGVSVYIDRYGNERERLDYGVTGNLDVKLRKEDMITSGPTLFQKYGVLCLMGLIGLLFLFQGILLKYNHAKNTSHS